MEICRCFFRPFVSGRPSVPCCGAPHGPPPSRPPGAAWRSRSAARRRPPGGTAAAAADGGRWSQDLIGKLGENVGKICCEQWWNIHGLDDRFDLFWYEINWNNDTVGLILDSLDDLPEPIGTWGFSASIAPRGIGRWHPTWHRSNLAGAAWQNSWRGISRRFGSQNWLPGYINSLQTGKWPMKMEKNMMLTSPDLWWWCFMAMSPCPKNVRLLYRFYTVWHHPKLTVPQSWKLGSSHSASCLLSSSARSFALIQARWKLAGLASGTPVVVLSSTSGSMFFNCLGGMKKKKLAGTRNRCFWCFTTVLLKLCLGKSVFGGNPDQY